VCVRVQVTRLKGQVTRYKNQVKELEVREDELLKEKRRQAKEASPLVYPLPCYTWKIIHFILAV